MDHALGPTMVDLFDHIIASLGPTALLVLGLAALLEYVFPPFPGDTITLLGGVYAVRGHHSVWGVLLVLTAGSVVGAAINHTAGLWLANRFEQKPTAKPLFGLTPDRLAGVLGRMERHGTWLLLVNRFLPGIRGIIFLAAGTARLPRGRVLGLGAVSAAVYNALILTLGFVLGGNLERMAYWVSRYQWAVVGLVVTAVVAFGLKWFSAWRR